MKALIATIMMVFVIGGHSVAFGTPSEEVKKKNTENRELLSPEQVKLFKEGRLNETVVKPVYTSTDQLINRELIKKIKEKAN